MKKLDLLTRSELIEYLKELQPFLRWDFSKLTDIELKECIRMHFSNK